MKLPKHTFAGITFAGRVRGDCITVPIPAFKKILRSGKANIVCTNRLTDDFTDDAERNFDRGTVPDVEDVIKDYLTNDKPWLLYYNKAENKIRFCPLQSLSYDVTEK